DFEEVRAETGEDVRVGDWRNRSAGYRGRRRPRTGDWHPRLHCNLREGAPSHKLPAIQAAVMTDQVDVGWASPPFGRKEIEEGKIHLVARATDATLVRDQTIRVLVANADAMANRKEVI